MTGSPALSAVETITVTVNEINKEPALDPIGDRTVNEGEPLLLVVHANDPDRPANTLTFSLDSGAPSGASIDPNTGVFSWTPTEGQGPGSYTITVRVTDDGTPALSDSETITVTVDEVNASPILAAISDKMVTEGTALAFTATASDPDLPANSLTFSLDAGAPVGRVDRPEHRCVHLDTHGESVPGHLPYHGPRHG